MNGDNPPVYDSDFIDPIHVFAPPLQRRRGFIMLPELEDHSQRANDDLGIPCPDSAAPTIEARPIVLACVICRQNQIQTVNFPCMHATFCLECARPSVEHSKRCPICRTDYVHISMLYLSYQDTDSPGPKRTKIEDGKQN